MISETLSPQQIETAIATKERRGLVVSAAISIAIVAGAVLFLFYAAHLLQSTNAKLTAVQAELGERQAELTRTVAANADAKATEARLQAEIGTMRSDIERANSEKTKLLADVAAAQANADRANAEVARLRTAVDDANKQLEALAGQIRSSTDYAEHLHKVDWEDAKYLYGSSNRLAEMFTKILELRDKKLPFNLNNTVEQGFTSPGFAAYILGQMGIVRPGTPLTSALDSLPKTDTPRLGDLILYSGGFAMFYLQDHQKDPFVIGMTPAGIAALQPDFGVPQESIRRTGIVP